MELALQHVYSYTIPITQAKQIRYLQALLQTNGRKAQNKYYILTILIKPLHCFCTIFYVIFVIVILTNYRKKNFFTK